MNDTPSHSNGAAGGNDAAGGAPSFEDKEEMAAAIHELSGALLDLSQCLKTLSEAASEADAKAAPEKPGPSGAPRSGALQKKPEGKPTCLPPTTSRYQAVGRPFGPGAAARGLWRLFKQKTTRN